MKGRQRTEQVNEEEGKEHGEKDDRISLSRKKHTEAHKEEK